MEQNLPATIQLDEANFDLVLDMLMQGQHYRDIATHFGTSLTTLFRYLSSKEHSARVTEAREFAAYVLADEAERVLAQAKNDPRLFPVAQQLAHHYRWKAAMFNRRQFADRKVVIQEDSPDKEKDTLIIRVVEDGDD